METQATPTSKVHEEARRAAGLYTDINAACPYPWGTAEALEFKREFLAERSRIELEQSIGDYENDYDDPLLCNCASDGFTVQELETGKCQGCGKAVVL